VWGAGCAGWQELRGPAFTQEFAGWTDSLRSKDGAAQPWGYSTKAQQIERNLGVAP
jgi:hypothetical protein